MVRYLWLFLLLIVWPTVYAAEDEEMDDLQGKLTNEWRLVRNDQMRHIKTYARLEDGKRYRSLKVEAILDCKMEAVARVLLDFPNYTKWFWQTRESRLLRQDSSTDYYVYMIHNAPYGLPDRDTILRGTIEPQTKSKRYVTLNVHAKPDLEPVKPPLVRMQAEELTIKFQPLPNDQVLIETEGYFDPGGTVPAWAANMVQRNAPYTVLLALQRTAAKEEYAKAKNPIPFTIYEYSDYNK